MNSLETNQNEIMFYNKLVVNPIVSCPGCGTELLTLIRPVNLGTRISMNLFRNISPALYTRGDRTECYNCKADFFFNGRLYFKGYGWLPK